jgi:beta-glucuronidase
MRKLKVMAAALGAFVLLAPVTTHASSPTLTRADAREGRDLSGTWHYSVDPYREGLVGFHGSPPIRRGTQI